MKVLENGPDRWRRITCRGCNSVLFVEDEDVLVERYWDEEDGCLDSRARILCCVCNRTITIEAPHDFKTCRLREQEF